MTGDLKLEKEKLNIRKNTDNIQKLENIKQSMTGDLRLERRKGEMILAYQIISPSPSKMRDMSVLCVVFTASFSMNIQKEKSGIELANVGCGLEKRTAHVGLSLCTYCYDNVKFGGRENYREYRREYTREYRKTPQYAEYKIANRAYDAN